jgi:hypothetical protein
VAVRPNHIESLESFVIQERKPHSREIPSGQFEVAESQSNYLQLVPSDSGYMSCVSGRTAIFVSEQSFMARSAARLRWTLSGARSDQREFQSSKPMKLRYHVSQIGKCRHFQLRVLPCWSTAVANEAAGGSKDRLAAVLQAAPRDDAPVERHGEFVA